MENNQSQAGLPIQTNPIGQTTKTRSEIWPIIALLFAMFITYLAYSNSSKAGSDCQFRGSCSPSIIIYYLVTTGLALYGALSLSLAKIPTALRWRGIGFWGSVTSVIALTAYIYQSFWPELPVTTTGGGHFLVYEPLIAMIVAVVAVILNIITLTSPGQKLKTQATFWLICLGLLWGYVLFLGLTIGQLG